MDRQLSQDPLDPVSSASGPRPNFVLPTGHLLVIIMMVQGKQSDDVAGTAMQLAGAVAMEHTLSLRMP